MTTVRVGLRYMAVLIGTYLLVAHYTGAGQLIQKGSAGVKDVGVGLTKALQGR